MRARPIVFVSKCLGFEACRWDGAIINDKFVERLGKHVNFLTNCPEKEIGLGCPRSPIRIVQLDGRKTLYQPATDIDISKEMAKYTAKLAASLKREDLSGFILKSRSPSCGIKDVKQYKSAKENSAPAGATSGYFGEAVLSGFGGLAIEDDGRLSNFLIRENFLTKVFVHAEFLRIKHSGKPRDLTEFQANNKLLLMSFSEKEMRILGKLAANLENKPFQTVISLYEVHLLKAFENPSTFKANINVLEHALGYFKEELTKEEKKYFLQSLEKYRKGKLPLSAVTALLQLWILKYRVEYLRDQTYFSPYPEELVDISDSGKGR